MELNLQTLFWQLRAPTPPPTNIVILAIDDYSLDQGRLYSRDPQGLSYFEPLQTWPWRRSVYATIIDRLMQAGARTVAVDLVFAEPSTYGAEDDAQLQRVLQTYGDRVVLAASYEENFTRPGSIIQLIRPLAPLEQALPAIGSINYTIEADDRIHFMAREFPRRWAANNPIYAKEFSDLIATVPSFEQAILDSTRLPYPPPTGNQIFFYGPTGTFEQLSFSDILDPNTWKTYLQNGDYFKDKIVLIGSTATLSQDFHATPVALKMPGVEIHANSIATLLEGRSISDVFPQSYQRGLIVFVEVALIGLILNRQRQWRQCLALGTGLGLLVGVVGFLSVTIGYRRLPTAMPMTLVLLTGCVYSVDKANRDIQTKHRLRKTIKHYASAPIIQEMITQDADLQDLLQEKEQELLDSLLRNRYQITRRLSGGGFGATYLAKDKERPGHPYCVIKQLRPASNDPKTWEIARRLFLREAEALELLGKYDRIPQLLAYFEEDGEFYLVQEWIDGHSLSYELQLIIPKPEIKALCVLEDLLQTLEVVHQHGVIHRDIKPENIIRRHRDGKLELIDFGAVKEIRQSQLNGEATSDLTIGIGTRGYTPSEQAIGRPNFSSDIYAVGMIGIQLLTGLHPRHFKVDSTTGNVVWQTKVTVDPRFAAILDRMVCYNFRDRYQSAQAVLEDLKPLVAEIPPDFLTDFAITIGISDLVGEVPDAMGSTLPWAHPSTSKNL